MDIRFQVQTKINKPIAEVFDAIVNPEKLCRYFTTESTGPLVERKTVVWRWKHYNAANCSVKVKKLEKNKFICMEWEPASCPQTGGAMPYKTTFEITLEPINKNNTLVKICEYGWKSDQAGLNSSYENCQGWQHMTSCMKAWLEHGIDLR